MVENKGDTKPPKQQQSSPKDPEDSSQHHHHHHHHLHQQQHPPSAVVSGAPFISSAPLYLPIAPNEPQFEAVNPKRTRYNSGQWKLLSPPIPPTQTSQLALISSESTPSPGNPQIHGGAAASSSDTASSPPISPLQSTQDTTKSESEQFLHHQTRKGKYVSPVWKPNEMLWLAKAWRLQYQGGSDGSGSGSGSSVAGEVQSTRGKTRADKDREVAEFLLRHGINRDAKTAGTKWDNMLGEFRKVYEWEKGGERELVGKSYFRLSPYERKVHRLPASFDEEVFEELSQFMGPRMRSGSQNRGISSSIVPVDENRPMFRALPPPPPLKDDDFSIPGQGRGKHIAIPSGSDAFYHGSRGSSYLGLEPSFDLGVGVGISSTPTSRELRRIGKIRMTWEESVNLWAEEGEHHRGRVRLQGSSFMNADELTFFDDSMVASTMEAFEDGPLKGFSVDKFLNGQQVKVFGRRKSSSPGSGFFERSQFPFSEPSSRSMAALELQDPTDYYLGCLKTPPPSLPSLFELSWHIQEPPPEEFRFPLRRDVYKDLPPGKEIFFTTSNESLDSRAFVCDILSPIIRTNPSLTAATATCRDSYIPLWDDCINRVVSKFCPVEFSTIRKPSTSVSEPIQDQWPNVTGFVKNLCLWRGEEIDQLRENQINPSSSIIEKLLWSYMDLPYLLGYYAVGYTVTFCAMSRVQDRIIRTDLDTFDLSTPSARMKVLVPCWRIACLLPLLADHLVNGVYKQFPFSDFQRHNLSNGSVLEMTPNTTVRFFASKSKWTAVKETYDILDHRVPHAEFITRVSEKDLALVFQPRGCRFNPASIDQLVEALMCVTKALVALHDLLYMHRDLAWDKVLRRSDRESEWFVTGFDEAVQAPQVYPHVVVGTEARGRHAPEMGRGAVHGVKVDVWGIGYLVKTCGLSNVPKLLRELQSRCLDQNPEQRPTAADCYHHLLQLQSSLQSAAAAGGSGGAF